MNNEKEWTDEDIKKLGKLWADAQHSLAAIGRALNRSKNSIAGKAHRMNLPPRPSPIKRIGSAGAQPRTFTPRRVTGSTLPALSSIEHATQAAPKQTTSALHSVVPSAVPDTPIPRAVAPVLASGRACSWPIGEPGTKSFRFCDEPAQFGKVYCPEHHAIATIPANALRRESATLADVESYAAEHRVIVKPASGLLGLLVAVNNHRRAVGSIPFTLSKHGSAHPSSAAAYAERSAT